MYRFAWPDDPSVDFHLTHGDWVRLLRRHGFTIEDLIELRAPRCGLRLRLRHGRVGAQLAVRGGLACPPHLGARGRGLTGVRRAGPRGGGGGGRGARAAAGRRGAAAGGGGGGVGGGVDAGEAGDLAGPGLGVQALGVAARTRRAACRRTPRRRAARRRRAWPDAVAVRPVGADDRDERHHPGVGDQAGDLADPADVLGAVGRPRTRGRRSGHGGGCRRRGCTPGGLGRPAGARPRRRPSTSPSPTAR